jgi:hypothetical protein
MSAVKLRQLMRGGSLVLADIASADDDLLGTILPLRIPDPATLQERLRVLTEQIAAREVEWDSLDRRGDPAAFLASIPVAKRLEELRADAAPLPTAIETAQRRRAAFVALAAHFDTAGVDVANRTRMLLEQPPTDPQERERQLRALDQATRIHVRLAGRLAAISSSQQFREPPDALRVLRRELDIRIGELDRLRLPGVRPALEWPAEMLDLIDVVEDRSRRETA